MKLSLQSCIVLGSGIAASLNLNADVISAFTNAADLSNFTITNAAGSNAGTEIVNATTTPQSFLDGDAIRMYDGPDDPLTNRSTLQYSNATAFTGGVQVSFDIFDLSTGNANLFRIGGSGANLGAAAQTTLGIQIISSGTIATQTGSNTSFPDAFTPGTRANISVIYNNTAGNLDLSAEGGPNLAAGTWAVLVDGSVLTSGLSTWSTTDAQDFAFLTGTAGSQSGMNIQYDNIVIRTGSDITVVPEPSTMALLAGLSVLGLVCFRRMRA